MLTAEPAAAPEPRVDFATSPERYRHWRLSVDGRVATLALDVDENGGLRPGYALKLNSYDLGVDIELRDALDRIRFEHPGVACVVITSAKDRTFCAGANIYMLGASSHRWKVNFCKFTNETRNGMEDSSRRDGLRFVAAVNGACAGGGYELALACDEILMVDDRATTVSLPEVPLLGVLPGTGGLTRLVDKRGVRRDIADMFCTNADGVRAQRACGWRLIDGSAPPSEFDALVRERAEALAGASSRPAAVSGIALRPLQRDAAPGGLQYPNLRVDLDGERSVATLTVLAPRGPQPANIDAILAAGDAWWPLALARELDDAILTLRTNEPALGLWLLRSEGSVDDVLAADAALRVHADHWLVRETIGALRRTLARLETSARSIYALVDRGSCFAGLLFELALAADRTYMLALPDDPDAAPVVALASSNDGLFPTVAGRSRLAERFAGDETLLAERAQDARSSQRFDAHAALDAGLVTAAPDDLDWDDEIRLAVEERTALSPDALTAMEQNLRFPGAETAETKIFGRLSAWQNWVFVRPNATGERGALTLFGSGSRPDFDAERV